MQNCEPNSPIHILLKPHTAFHAADEYLSCVKNISNRKCLIASNRFLLLPFALLHSHSYFSRKTSPTIRLGISFGLFCTCPSRHSTLPFTQCSAIRFCSSTWDTRSKSRKKERKDRFCGGIATKALSHAVLIIAAEHIVSAQDPRKTKKMNLLC